jgi:hypothetical protein
LLALAAKLAEMPEHLKLKRRISGTISLRIVVIFLVSGISLLFLSIFYESQILAFIGLSLTFWGVLFLLLTPARYVEGSLLNSTIVASYSTIDRITKDLKYTGKGYYIPPYPKDVYLPEHLKGLKDAVVFIPAESDFAMPAIEQMAQGRFLVEKPKGMLVAPPGLGLLTQIEKETNVDFIKIGLSELCEVLPRAILQNFGLAKDIAVTLEKNQVNLRILDSIYKNLYSSENNLKSVSLLGCPIVSAVACILAKVSGKAITIQRHIVSPDGLTIEVWYRIMQG